MKKLTVLILALLVVAWSGSMAQTYKVTFKVNMKLELQLGKLTTADKVSARGNFNDWGETEMKDADGDMIYEVEASFDKVKLTNGLTLAFKFFHNGAAATNTGWESIDDRKIDITGDKVLDVLWYDNKGISGAKATVEFRANMKLPLKQGDLLKTPIPGKVFIAGDFNGWNTSATELTDADDDSIYTATLDTITSGTTVNYKFLYSNKANATIWENDPNKTALILDGTNKVERFFNDVNPNVQLKDGTVSFYVNMAVLEQLKVYDAAVDLLEVRGNFNGWSSADKDRSAMLQDFLFPTSWFLPVGFVKAEVPSDNFYKYFVGKKDTTGWADGYERPLSRGGGNRLFTYQGQPNQETPSVHYDDVLPGFYTSKAISIKFRVDMKDAFDATKIAVPMKAGDKVFYISEQPLFCKVMGWRDSDSQTYFELTDADGDKIYEGTLTMKAGGFNGFEYRYGIQRAADKSFTLETGGFAQNAYRVRYIPQTSKGTFTQPYTAPLDKWTDKEDKSDQFEVAPLGFTDVQDLESGIPSKFSLDQNYPNPFNPTTTIKFAIPADENVSLKVFNVLGQEVVTLVNKQMKAGSYSFDFNASKLSSGVYFYRVEAGSFNATKKMLLLK
ncbi:MAG: T9SS type A sorting domain-containing protein [Melioribacteraceae bacterium]